MNKDFCQACSATLQPVFENLSRRKTDTPQYKGVLHIKLWGGYGEYIDGKIDITMCKLCAQNLVLSTPWLASVVNGS